MQNIRRASLYLFYGLLAYMPLHIFLSTWLGTTFGVLEVAKIAKDVVLVIGFLLALAVSVRTDWFGRLLKDKLVWLITAYATLTLLLALLRPTDNDAEVLGVVYNLRFFVFFLYGGLLARLFEVKVVRKNAVRIVLAVAAVVLFFGVAQYSVLPDTALERVGYGSSNGVLPVFYIDDKPDFERVMSTLRDPNSLGSYTIIPAMLAVAFLVQKKLDRRSAIGLVLLSALCLLFTFSRSAWIGIALALVVLLAVQYGGRLRRNKKYQKVGFIVAASLLLALVAVYPLRNTYFVQNVIFHADKTTVLEDPNQLRTRFFRESVNGIMQDPLGSGPGTAGLASIRNNVQGTELNENYYLQIGSEAGVLGLVLFLAIIIVVGRNLLRESKHDAAVLALFVSLVGLCFTNLLVHIWSNEAVAYTWWGLAGLWVLKDTLVSPRPIKAKLQK